MAGWRRGLAIPGQPDFAWPVLKVAVFVDGCFWHGHDCDRNLKPKRNARYWQEKIQRNVARDRRVSRRLKKNGWTVIRIWECMLTKSPTRCLNQIGTALRRAETRQSVLARVS